MRFTREQVSGAAEDAFGRETERVMKRRLLESISYSRRVLLIEWDLSYKALDEEQVRQLLPYSMANHSQEDTERFQPQYRTQNLDTRFPKRPCLDMVAVRAIASISCWLFQYGATVFRRFPHNLRIIQRSYSCSSSLSVNFRVFACTSHGA